MVKVFLKHGRDESLRRFHPWVFSGAVAQVQGSPAEGDIVGVYSAEGQFLASGHWQVGSIAVRILSFDADPTAPGFWVDSIARALEVRSSVGLFAPGSQDSPRQNFASLIPPTASQRVPPVHEATGGHGSAGQTLADASLSGGIQPVVREVQTFYEQLFLEQGYPITYLAFVIDHEGPYVSPKDPEEFDTKAWRAAEGPRLLFGHDSAETRRQKLHDRASVEKLIKKTEK